MKALKPFKVTATGPLYRVKTASQVNQKLVDSVEWRKEHYLLGFDFKLLPLPPKPIRFGLSRKYSWRLASYSPGVGIKSPLKPCPPAGITVRAPASRAEHVKFIEISYKAYLKEWGKLVPTGVAKYYPKYIKEYPQKLTSLLVFKGQKFCGMFSHVKTTGVMGDKQNYMTWYALVPGLTPAERRSVHYQASVWLKKTATRRVAVLVESFEKDGFKFFSSLGFFARRIVIERHP
jgi:hypothetical protein